MTVEELQERVLQLEEENATLTEERNTLSENNRTLTEDLNRARSLNQKLLLKIPTTQNEPEPEPEPEPEFMGVDAFSHSISII